MREKTADEGRQDKGMNNQLKQELKWLRQRVTELEQAKNEWGRLEETLQKSEKKYRDLVESLPDVIYLVDEHGIVTYVNPAIETTLGYTPAEVIGHHFTEFVYQEDIPLIKEGFQHVLSGHVMANEYRFLTKLGEIRWMRTASRPTFERNHVIGTHGALTDITEEKSAEASLRESESRYRNIFESTTDALLIFNLDGVIVAANP
ncbi:PAS domain S-box protein, partial [Candidatus Bipolaricaulota bacterium]|nr:PAS domain S-box protein [Candidatus Bipolaricaulota bacterium]